jgi:hypothetical protein
MKFTNIKIKNTNNIESYKNSINSILNYYNKIKINKWIEFNN